MTERRFVISYAVAFAALSIVDRSLAQSPFATRVIEYDPAPGQFVQNLTFNDPSQALGRPIGAGIGNGNNSSIVTLGGFGGSITLAFDHTVSDDRANPLGLDAIVFGNAFWVGTPPDPNRHWAEAGAIEVCRDLNGNGTPDDNEPWYLIAGSHITDPVAQFQTQTWDTDVGNPTYPPAIPTWIPLGRFGVWQTASFRLPSEIFDTVLIENPIGSDATDEGIFGYADYSPTLVLGDNNADDRVDDETITPEEFYTNPDDPHRVGMRPRSGGGDAFDIAWAIDPQTGEPAELDGFDFIRITNAVNQVIGSLGEVSTEIDAVADVAPGLMGDADANGTVDLQDFVVFDDCMTKPETQKLSIPCRVMDFDGDDHVNLKDFATFQQAFTGAP